jgi:hypothetical protein
MVYAVIAAGLATFWALVAALVELVLFGGVQRWVYGGVWVVVFVFVKKGVLWRSR